MKESRFLVVFLMILTSVSLNCSGGRGVNDGSDADVNNDAETDSDGDIDTETEPEFDSFEFTVTDLADWQQVNDVAMNEDGTFVIVWHDESMTGADTDLAAVRARIYNPDGSPMGDEFVVNSETDGRQQTPMVDIWDDGSFVVAFSTMNLLSPGQNNVLVRRFDASGSPLESDQIAIAGGSQADVAILSDGSYVVTGHIVGEKLPTTERDLDVVCRHFDRDGTPRGEAFLVSQDGDSRAQWPRVAASPEGGFTVTWLELYADSQGPTGSLARRFNNDDSPATDTFSISGIGWPDRILHLADGGLVVYGTRFEDHLSTERSYARIFEADGTPRTDAFRPHDEDYPQRQIIAAGLAEIAGGSPEATILFSFTFNQMGTGTCDIMARAYDTQGNPVENPDTFTEEPFIVYKPNPDPQWREYPVSAANSSGHVVIVWIEEWEYFEENISFVGGDLMGRLFLPFVHPTEP